MIMDNRDKNAISHSTRSSVSDPRLEIRHRHDYGLEDKDDRKGGKFDDTY